MRCRHVKNNKQRCKAYTHDASGYCYHHRPKEPVHLEAKPLECPVCYESLHQTTRPLSCGHWIHRTCVKKSGVAECPICRKAQDIPVSKATNSDSDLDSDSDVEVFEIPEVNIIMAVLLFRLSRRFLRSHRLGLSDIISALINDILPTNHPYHRTLTAFLYGEALLLLSRF